MMSRSREGDQEAEREKPSGAPALPFRADRIEASLRSWQFWLGFVGWFVVNGLIGLVLFRGADDESLTLLNGLLLFPANVIALVALAAARRTRRVAGGMLTAIALNLLVSLIRGMVFNALCFVPFFIGSP